MDERYPSEAAIEHLRANPQLAPQFNAKYGEGRASQFVEAAAAPAQGDEEGGIMEAVGDVAAGVVDGVANAGLETLQFVDRYLPSAPGDSRSSSEGSPGIQGITSDDVSIYSEDDAAEAEPTYTVPRGIAQFLTGFVGAGKITGAVKAGGKAARLGKAALDGALADAVVFDPHDPRFANVMQEWLPESLQNPVVDYLAAEETDSDAEGRLKNAIEGLGLGLLADGVFAAVKGIRNVAVARRSGAGDEAVEAAARAAAEETDSLLPAGLADAVDEGAAFPEGEIVVNGGGRAAAEGEKRVFGPVDKAKLSDEIVTAVAASDRSPAQVLDVLSRASEGGLSSFNFTKMDGPVDAKAALSTTMEAIGPALRDALGDGPETFDTLTARAAEEVSDMLGVGYDQYLSRVRQSAAAAQEQAKHLVAGKMVLQSMGHQLAELSRLVKQDAASDAQKAQWVHLQDAMADLAGNLRVIQTGTARTVSAGRVRTANALDADDMDALGVIASYGGPERLRQVAEAVALAGDNTKAALVAVERSRLRKGMDAFNEYWINSILSGPKTHMVNMVSNAANTVFRPAAELAGATISGDRETAAAAMGQFATMHQGVMDSWRMALQAVRAGENILDVRSTVDDRQITYATGPDALGLDPSTRFASFLRATSTAINLPTRALMAEDEFFKQLNYRSTLYGRLWAEARAKGLKGEARSTYVAAEFNRRALNPDGSAKTTTDALGREKLTTDALRGLEAARFSTFTTELPQGGVGRSLQSFAQRHPAFRLLMPFIRTPTNIIKQAVAITPGARHLLKEYRDALASNDPATRARARGQAALGNLMTAVVVAQVINGSVTGGGPRDPKQRALWMEKGWRPYSVKVGDTWVEYRRMDPYATLVGTIADFAETFSSEDSGAHGAELATILTLSVAKNLTDKTYLSGISDFIDAISSPDRPDKMERYAQRFASSLVPYSSFLGQTAYEVDPHIRETRGLIEATKARIPGLSDTLPARHSWLTGEPLARPEVYLNPLTFEAADEGNPVAEELLRIGKTYQAPRTIHGVELTAVEYSELTRRIGKTRLNGRTLMQTLSRHMASNAYDYAREEVPDAPEGVDGFRKDSVDKIITTYYRAALESMVSPRSEDRLPEFADRYVKAREAKGFGASRSPEGVERSRQLLEQLAE
jgi:hypothetical protein